MTSNKDPNKLVIVVPKRKRPFEMPSKKQKDRSKAIPRDEKHKGRGQEG